MTLPPVRHTMRLPMEKENCEWSMGRVMLSLFSHLGVFSQPINSGELDFTELAFTLGLKIRSGLFFPCSACSFFTGLGFALIQSLPCRLWARLDMK